MKDKVYLNQFFRKSRISIHPYLTIGIFRASQISEENERQIFNEQTLGRLFSYFLPHRAADIFSALHSNDGSTAFRACQLVNVKESEALSIKYCPLCAESDVKQYGVSYWHRVHQMPGIEACPYHQVWLIHHALPQRPHLKSGFLPKSGILSKPCSILSFNFAKYAKNFLTSITSTEDSFDQQSLITKLDNLGYITRNNSFRRKKLTFDLFSFASNLKHSPCELLPYSENDYRYLSYLLSGHVSQHPFKYLLIDFWLQSIHKCTSKKQNKDCKTTPPKSTKVSDICASLLKQGKPMSEITRQTGKSQCYLKLLSSQNNIPINTNPYKISCEVKKNIIAMAYKGFHRNAIAKKFKISTGSVEQTISSVEGLVQKRKRYKFESRRRRYKVKILRALQAHPKAIKQEIKQSCYAAFHWLYLHEKEWLNKILPRPTKPKPCSKVNWKERDEKLVPEVRSLMLKYSGCISRTKLDKEIGGHGWLIKNKHKLPLTMQVFQELKKTTQFQHNLSL